MKDDVTRRDFLKAAGLAVAGVVGASAISRAALAQEQNEDKDKSKEKGEDKDKSKDKSDKSKEKPNYDELFGDNSSGGEETRACPQCGSTMYRQGRTWTCENCGYSYVE